MAIRFTLALSLILVICIYVLPACKSKMNNSPSTLHWLRSLDPETECKQPTAEGIPVADLLDCMQFYVCDGAGSYTGPFQCGDGMKCYDPIKKDCTESMVTCNPICTSIGPECLTKCSAQYDQYFDHNDCSKHTLCLDAAGNDVFEDYCPSEHPYFNGQNCVSDKAQCCTCRVPTCTTVGDVADPQDCHSYYMCVSFGSGLAPVHATCEDGGSFDNNKGQCDPNINECTNDCDIGGDVTSTTTTTTTTTTTDGCTDLSDFTCPGNGFYARCTYCDPSYFNCNGPADTPTQGACDGGLMFNPNPEFPFCMRPENCPLNP